MPPLEDQPSLAETFRIHPIVAADSRIPPKMKDDLHGEHPGIFLSRLREAKGFHDPQAFVQAVNKVLIAERQTPDFTIQELAQFENGERSINNNRLPYLAGALQASVTEILYNLKPDRPDLSARYG